MPEVASPIVAPHLANLPRELDRGGKVPQEWSAVPFVNAPSIGKELGAPRTRPQKSVGEPVGGLRAIEIPANLVARDVAQYGDMCAGGPGRGVLGENAQVTGGL